MPRLLRLRRETMRGWCLWIGLTGCLATMEAVAVIFHATDDPAHHTTPPEGEWADSGWQWQGEWRGCVGTPIAPHWFLTAKHVGGKVGDVFRFAGEAWPVTAIFDDPASDLRLAQVCGELPSFAPLYEGADEVGQTAVVFGRGLSRGSRVTLTNAAEEVELRGWRWKSGTSALRWGLNRIEDTVPYETEPGTLLRATFDPDGGPAEAMWAGGDSGGGMFLQREGRWELAGVAYGVDGPFRYTADGADVNAALFDTRGFFERGGFGWTLITAKGAPRPAALYASRIGARRDWILSTMAQHPAPEVFPTVWRASSAEGSYEEEAAMVDVVRQEIRVSLPAGVAFFKLSACRYLRIVGVAAEGVELVLRYQ